MVGTYEDVMKFWSELMHSENPGWSSENEVDLETNTLKLRRFIRESGSNNQDLPPILIIPPQAGHHSCIADYEAPNQSLVKTCLDHTENPVYAIEWKTATHSARHDRIDELIDYLEVCVEKLGQKVHLVGLCQGGWLSAIFASMFPERVESLLLGAAPIDFTAGGGKLQEMVQSIPMSFYESLVASGGGILWGGHMLMGWKVMNFYDRFCGDYVNMWLNINNETFLQRSRKFRAWYDYTQDISGAWYLQAVEELFKNNNLIKKKLAVRNQSVDLSKITCPVALLAGEKDDITLIPQLFNMSDYISTPDAHIHKDVIPDCGHIGTFMGKNAQGHWVEALQFVAQALEEQSEMDMTDESQKSVSGKGI